MADALEEHGERVSIDGRNIANLWFADNIDAPAEEEKEYETLAGSLDKICNKYKKEMRSVLRRPHQCQTLLMAKGQKDQGEKTECEHHKRFQIPWRGCLR